jgi:hypothetical protein
MYQVIIQEKIKARENRIIEKNPETAEIINLINQGYFCLILATPTVLTFYSEEEYSFINEIEPENKDQEITFDINNMDKFICEEQERNKKDSCQSKAVAKAIEKYISENQ